MITDDLHGGVDFLDLPVAQPFHLFHVIIHLTYERGSTLVLAFATRGGTVNEPWGRAGRTELWIDLHDGYSCTGNVVRRHNCLWRYPP